MKIEANSIAIVGGGVIGLSIANELVAGGRLDESTTLDLYSPQNIEETTSATAAAFWAPYWVGDYPRQWAIETLAKLALMADEGVPGVHWLGFEEWLTDEGLVELQSELNEINHDAAYWWRDLPGIDFGIEPMAEPIERTVPPLPPALLTHRARFRTVVARMSDYLAHLHDVAIGSGKVRMVPEWVDDLNAIAPRYDLVFNCTGWGAKAICKEDPETRDMRLLAGMVCRVENDRVSTATLLHRAPFHDTPLYIVPRRGERSDVICGGTAIDVSPAPDPRLPVEAPDPRLWQLIMQRCRNLEPRLDPTDPQADLCGLRPVRKSVRVEVDLRHNNVIHCYGHGGSGLTLSWGSARAAINLAR